MGSGGVIVLLLLTRPSPPAIDERRVDEPLDVRPRLEVWQAALRIHEDADLAPYHEMHDAGFQTSIRPVIEHAVVVLFIPERDPSWISDVKDWSRLR